MKSRSGVVQPLFPQNINTIRTYSYRVATSVGVRGDSIPLIGNGFASGRVHVRGLIEVA